MDKPEITIKSQWDQFAAVVLSPERGFSRIQILESRRMFYSGFIACLGVMDELGDRGEEETITTLKNIHREWDQFVEKMKKGGA